MLQKNIPDVRIYILPHVVFVIQPILVYFQLTETFDKIQKSFKPTKENLVSTALAVLSLSNRLYIDCSRAVIV